jgi:hypothetical protein
LINEHGIKLSLIRNLYLLDSEKYPNTLAVAKNNSWNRESNKNKPIANMVSPSKGNKAGGS